MIVIRRLRALYRASCTTLETIRSNKLRKYYTDQELRTTTVNVITGLHSDPLGESTTSKCERRYSRPANVHSCNLLYMLDILHALFADEACGMMYANTCAYLESMTS